VKGRFFPAVAAAATLIWSAGAMAQMSTDYVSKPPAARTPWYVGAGFVGANSKVPQGSIDAFGASGASALGAQSYIVNKDQRTTGAKVFLGYQFNKYLAIEGGGVHFGEPGFGYQYYSGGSGIGEEKINYAMGAVFLDAVGSWYFTDRWAVLGRVGVSRGQTRVDFNGSPLVYIASNTDRTERVTRAKFGLGIQYDMTDAFRFRAEWERYTLPDPLSSDKVKVDTYSASLLYQF
jgi:OOP family OmpA-OmpF porin